MCDDLRKLTGPGCCHKPAGRIQGFYQPWLLLYLSERRAHGYELLERLRQNEDTRRTDPAALYRTLRQFEGEGLVCSSWDVEGAGPARRVYELTAGGIEYLHAWARHIRSTRARLGRVLEAYEDHLTRQATPKDGRKKGE